MPYLCFVQIKIMTMKILSQSKLLIGTALLCTTLSLMLSCSGCGGVKDASIPNSNKSTALDHKTKQGNESEDHTHNDTQIEEETVAPPQLIPPPNQSKITFWKDAKIVAKINPQTGRPYGDNTYKTYVLDNGFAQRESRVDYFDKDGNVIKSIDFRNADFAPPILQAQEKDDSLTMRLEDLKFERKSLTKEQIKSTLHADYRNNKKVLDDYTSSLIYFVSDEGPNKSIILEQST